MNNEEPKPEDDPLIPTSYKALGLGLGALWFLCLLILGMFACDKPSIERAASLGDAFGTLNSLFSVLALGAAIAGILIQGKEFRKQVEEMTKSSLEMEQQTRIYQEQLDELKSQTRSLRKERDQKEIQAKIEALPFFLVTCSHGPGRVDISIKNEGINVLQLRVKVDAVEGVWCTPILRSGVGAFSFHWTQEMGRTLPGNEVIIRLQYVLILGDMLSETIVMSADRKPAEVFHSDRANQVKKLPTSFRIGRIMDTLFD